jgi:undecaprenyl-diphosphatase
MLDSLLAADATLLRQIVSWPHPDWLNSVFLAASKVGVGGSIWVLLGLILFVTRQINRVEFVRLLLAIVLVHIAVDLWLKPWVGRIRPPFAIPDLSVIGDVPRTPSFPSGHAANAIAAAVVLTTSLGNTAARWVIWIAAAIVSVARVYLGVHYPLDASVGVIVGWLCGMGALTVALPQGPPVRRPARTNDEVQPDRHRAA